MSEEYNLVKLLNNPEDYYPGNFETPEKACAFLMCLCQEAADKIEKLMAKPSPARKPLTEEEIDKQYQLDQWYSGDAGFYAGIRWAEKHHGIEGNGLTLQDQCRGDKL